MIVHVPKCAEDGQSISIVSTLHPSFRKFKSALAVNKFVPGHFSRWKCNDGGGRMIMIFALKKATGLASERAKTWYAAS
jgi:hypothetical protein